MKLLKVTSLSHARSSQQDSAQLLDGLSTNSEHQLAGRWRGELSSPKKFKEPLPAINSLSLVVQNVLCTFSSPPGPLVCLVEETERTGRPCESRWEQSQIAKLKRAKDEASMQELVSRRRRDALEVQVEAVEAELVHIRQRRQTLVKHLLLFFSRVPYDSIPHLAVSMCRTLV